MFRIIRRLAEALLRRRRQRVQRTVPYHGPLCDDCGDWPAYEVGAVWRPGDGVTVRVMCVECLDWGVEA